MTSVLIIEDDEITAEVLSSIFELEGFKVKVANTPEHALQLTSELKQDVTISDWRMGNQNPGEFLTPIRAQLPNMHLILMTGTEMDELGVRTKELNVSRVFIKPVDLEVVVRFVKKLISQGSSEISGKI